MDWLHLKELIFMEWFQPFRTPFLDRFFLFWNFFDTSLYYILIIPLLWAGYDWKWGSRFFFILLINDSINHLAKNLFAQGRPDDFIPSLGVIHKNTYGMPSGGAQTAILIASIFIYTHRNNKWAWIAGINYIFWISLSRIYLGVHFPSDVLGGWILGGLLFIAFIYLLPFIEKWIENRSLWLLFLLSQGIPLMILAFYQSNRSLWFNSASMGVSLGLICSKRYQLFLAKTTTWLEGVSRFFIASIVILVMIYAISSFSEIWSKEIVWITCLFGYSMGLWISLGFTLLWRFFTSRNRKKRA
jgi:undecaprenyl-diphosphatase